MPQWKEAQNNGQGHRTQMSKHKCKNTGTFVVMRYGWISRKPDRLMWCFCDREGDRFGDKTVYIGYNSSHISAEDSSK